MDVRDKIKAYLKERGAQMKWFEEKIGMPERTIYQFLASKKKSIPRKYWKKIIKLTKGKITLQDLAELDKFEEEE